MTKNGKKKLATVHDVARLAQVSPATVSRVFDPKWQGRIKDSTRERVMVASRETGYTPNAIARSLYTNRTNIVAIVMGEYTGPFYAEIFFEISKQIQAYGKQVLVFSVDPSIGVERIVSQVLQYRVDAILILANATSEYIEDYFTEAGTPVVLFDRVSTSKKVSCVCSDNEYGARMAADYLLDCGHKKIAYISGDANASQSLARSQGFLDQLQKRNSEAVAIEKGDFTYECGFSAMERLLETIQFDAVFCADDTMAMGAVDAARKHGISVPDQVSVVGFDNHVASQLPPYSLTTIGHNKEKLFRAVVKCIEEVIADPDTKQQLYYPMRLVERSSVKKRS